MIIDIDKQTLIQMIYSTYNNSEGYDVSELKTEIILENYEDDSDDVIKFDNLFDIIKFGTCLYYFHDFPGKLNIEDFENDFENLYPYEDYKRDCEEFGQIPDKMDWYEELSQLIPEGASVTPFGVVVNH